MAIAFSFFHMLDFFTTFFLLYVRDHPIYTELNPIGRLILSFFGFRGLYWVSLLGGILAIFIALAILKYNVKDRVFIRRMEIVFWLLVFGSIVGVALGIVGILRDLALI